MPSLIELSNEIYQDLGSPDSPTMGVIQYWIRNHVSELNNLINTSYILDGTDGSIDPDINDLDSAIIKKMYLVYFYESKVRGSLGAAALDPVLEVSENGAVVRLINKNEIAKSYIQMKKEEQEELNRLVAMYRSNNAVPATVDGDDTDEQWYHGVSISNTRIKLS